MLAIRLPIDLHLPPQSPFCGPRRACAVNPVRGSPSLSLGDGRSRALPWAPSGIGPDDSGEITWPPSQISPLRRTAASKARLPRSASPHRSEEHTSELQSLMRISYAVFCLKKKKNPTTRQNTNTYSHTHYPHTQQ